MRLVLVLLLALSQAAFAEDFRNYCSASLELEISPESGDAAVKNTYTISCNSPVYLGQVTRVRTQLPYRLMEVQVLDNAGVLEPAQFDPAYYKITPQEKYTVVSLAPRNSILIGGFGNSYSFSEKYSVSDAVRAVDENSRLSPRDFVVVPELVVASADSTTSFQPEIKEYSVSLALPEGAELKESTAACKIEQGTVKCAKLSSLEGLSITWREKPLQEKIVQKGWPWVVLSVKSFFGRLFG